MRETPATHGPIHKFIWNFCGFYPPLYGIATIAGLTGAGLLELWLAVMVSLAWDYANNLENYEAE